MHSKAEGRTCSIRWQAEQERRREIQDCYAFQRNVQQRLIRRYHARHIALSRPTVEG